MPSSGDRSRSPRRRKRSASSDEEPEPSRSRRRYDSREGERRHQGHGTTDHADDHRIQQQDEEAAGVSDRPKAARTRSRSPRSRSRDRGRDNGSGRDRRRDRRRSSSRSRSRERPRQRRDDAAAAGDRSRGRDSGSRQQGGAPDGHHSSREQGQARDGQDSSSRGGGGGTGGSRRGRGDRWGYDAYAREEGDGGRGAGSADGDAAAAEVRKGRGFTARRSGRSRSRDRLGGSGAGRDAGERGKADRNGSGRGDERGRWAPAEDGTEGRHGSGREREADGAAGAAAAGGPEEDGAAAVVAGGPAAAAPAGDEAEASDFLKKKAALSGRAGGAYIPPFRLARMMAEIDDKNSVAAQKLSWEALRKSLNGLINKVNAPNIKDILPELFQENLMRGRGVFCQAIMKAQLASPTFSPLYAALISVVNTKFPELGELLCHRVIAQFKRAYKRNDKPITIAAAKFLAHLINQGVLHELLALEMLILLLENPSDDSVEMAVEFCKEVGAYLQDVAPAGLHSVFERFRAILHEGAIDRRCQYMIEGLFAVRKAGFEASGHPAVQPALDLVEDEDQITHEMSLDDKHDPQAILNVFREDPEYEAHEAQYRTIVKELLGDDDEEEEQGGEGGAAASGSGEEESDDEEEQQRQQQQQDIEDETGTNLVNLRRTIYLTIMSSLDFEEAGHKLMKIQLAPGQEPEIPIMIIECCSQEKTFVRYYALLGARFCMLRREFQATFEDCFAKQYAIIHRLETNKLRNVAKLFAHLLSVDGISWGVLGCIRLTEEDTTSSSRIFIKYLFQELSEYMGLVKLNQRLAEPSLQQYFTGIFPADSMANMRFSINFFTSIGLGGITDRQRELYKQMPRIMAERRAAEEAARKAAGGNSNSGGSSGGSSSSSSGSSSSSSSSGSSSSSSDSSSSDSDSDSGDSRRRRKKRR